MSDSLLIAFGDKIEHYANLIADKLMAIAPEVYETLVRQYLIHTIAWLVITTCILFVALSIFAWCGRVLEVKRREYKETDWPKVGVGHYYSGDQKVWARESISRFEYGRFWSAVGAFLIFVGPVGYNLYRLVTVLMNPNWAVWTMLRG